MLGGGFDVEARLKQLVDKAKDQAKTAAPAPTN
jgi:hypothetical protein